MRGARLRELSATGGALVVHLGLLASALIAPPPRSDAPGPPAEREIALEIEPTPPAPPPVAEVPPPAEQDPDEDEPEPAAAPAPVARAPAAAPAPPEAAPEAQPAAEAAPEPAPAAAAAPAAPPAAPEPVQPPAAPPAPLAAATPPPAPAPAAEAAPAPVAEAPATTPGAPGAPPGATPAPGDPGEYGGPPGPDVVAVPGVGAAPVWTVPGAVTGQRSRPAPTTPGAARPVDADVASKVLEGTLDKRDKELGLDVPAAGIVAGEIGAAARTAEIADEARATFEVDVAASGKIENVKVVSFSAGNDATWQRVAREAASSLAARGLNTNGEAAKVVVKVESKKLYPAGTKDKVDVQPVCANEVIEQMARSMAELAKGDGRGVVDPGGPTPIEDREATLDPRKRFCIPIGIGGRGDASNIGAHKQTVVRSTFEVKRKGQRDLPSDEVKPVEDRVRWLPARDSRVEKPKPPKKKKKKKKPGER